MTESKKKSKKKYRIETFFDPLMGDVSAWALRGGDRSGLIEYEVEADSVTEAKRIARRLRQQYQERVKATSALRGRAEGKEVPGPPPGTLSGN